jgi:hypothetical protein
MYVHWNQYLYVSKTNHLLGIVYHISRIGKQNLIFDVLKKLEEQWSEYARETFYKIMFDN